MHIICIAKNTAKVDAGPSSGKPKRHLLPRKRGLRLMIIMVIFFTVCWLPFLINQFLHDRNTFYWISSSLLIFYTACNPILYILGNQDIRQRFCMLKKHQHRNCNQITLSVHPSVLPTVY